MKRSSNSLQDDFQNRPISDTRVSFTAALKRKGFAESIVACATGLIALTLTHSLAIAGALSAVAIVFLYFSSSAMNKKEQSHIQLACPEVLDHLISGIRSGLSLTESLTSLAERGPDVLRPYFATFREDIYRHGNFEEALTRIQYELHNHSIDQIFEALILARSLGGSELMNIFRTLNEFIRQDITLRKEIEVKQSWIKNSAHLSAAAPWLLLLLLSTQPSTAHAYSTATGIMILCCGVGATAIAYLWMGRLAKMPDAPRIFGAR